MIKIPVTLLKAILKLITDYQETLISEGYDHEIVDLVREMIIDVLEDS